MYKEKVESGEDSEVGVVREEDGGRGWSMV